MWQRIKDTMLAVPLIVCMLPLVVYTEFTWNTRTDDTDDDRYV